MVTLGRDFFPPDFRDYRLYVTEMIVTIQIAIWGTVLAVLAAVPFGLLSSANLVPGWVYQPIRRLMDALRAVNEMVFALIFIVVEAVDPRPIEGIRVCGGGRLTEVIFGVIPQVLPLWISFCLYRFESNVRSASVVGMVGAGGIGTILYEVIRSFEYAQTCAVLIILIVSVSVIDLTSAYLRKLVT
jgi:phosphonate transport system permease protein